MTDRFSFENVTMAASMNAVDRIDLPKGVILIADGKSNEPEFMFMTIWAYGRSETDLQIARPLYFQAWGDNGPSTLEIRMKAAEIDARHWYEGIN